LYALPVVSFLFLRLVVTDTFAPMAMYNTVAQWLWLPAVPLFLVCLFLRRWLLVSALLPVAFAWGFTVGLRFIGDNSRAAAYSGQAFTALTYNIQWRSSDYRETLGIIRSADADIVALQEVGIEAADLIEASLSDLYPYMELNPQEWGIDGQALLSKYPIISAAFFTWGEVGFGNQVALIEHPAFRIPMTVYNIHLLNPWSLGTGFDIEPRRRETQALIERIQSEPAPYLLVLGDFNLNELNTDYQTLDRSLRDVYRDVGNGLGLTHSIRFSALPPLRLTRLDYIWVQGGLHPLRARVLPASGGSDHQPVWAEIEIYDPSLSYPNP
jgi:endonuclease/exonuclease/phosphatase family metal-dependent hydrolase